MVCTRFQVFETEWGWKYKRSERKSPAKRKLTTLRCTRAMPSNSMANTTIAISPKKLSTIATLRVTSDSKNAIRAGFYCGSSYLVSSLSFS